MKRIALTLAAILLTGCASSPNRAHVAIGADGVSTAKALAKGGKEVGPFGWWGIPLRWGIVEHAKKLPPAEGEPLIDLTDASSWGYALSNTLIAFGPGGWIVGGALGGIIYERAQLERQFMRHCEEHKAIVGQPGLTCMFAQYTPEKSSGVITAGAMEAP
ncbi:MAG: hypothetical protein V4669_13930 [Pseudomonadota bacterium]